MLAEIEAPVRIAAHQPCHHVLPRVVRLAEIEALVRIAAHAHVGASICQMATRIAARISQTAATVRFDCPSIFERLESHH